MADNITQYINGLPVLINNARYPQSNGKIDSIVEDNNWFITGPFDTGSTSSKKYSFIHTVAANSTSHASMRLFNDISSTSADYWTVTVNNNRTLSETFRTITSVGRYITFSIKKSDAADIWCYCYNTNSFVFKGENIDNRLSSLIQSRQRILMQPKRIQVIWNNFEPPFSTNLYRPYWSDTTSLTDVEEGIVKQAWLDNQAWVGYIATTRIKNINYSITEGHIMYSSHYIKPNQDGTYFSVEFGGGTIGSPSILAPKDEWTHISYMGPAIKTGNYPAYYGNRRSGTYAMASYGTYVLLKAPVYVDLTLMFGAGNEPDKETFEKQCAMNGIDLTTSQAQNINGTQRWWLV